MIPDTGARGRAPFPYVGLAAVVLLLHGILVALVPANPYRAAFSFAALFAVGYCTLALIVGVLLGGITAALIVFVALALVHFPGDLSPGLAIYGWDGTTGSLNHTFLQGQPQEIVVSALGGSTPGAFVVRIRLVPQNATGNESFHTVFLTTSPLRLDAFAEYNVSLVLGAGESWTRPFSISVEQPGAVNLYFALLDSSSSVVATNRLPVVVT